jgi:hypothetical protein
VSLFCFFPFSIAIFFLYFIHCSSGDEVLLESSLSKDNKQQQHSQKVGEQKGEGLGKGECLSGGILRKIRWKWPK